MSEYTPTTDEVRRDYVNTGWGADGSLEPRNDPAAFDAWLAQTIRTAQAAALRAWADEVVEHYPEDVWLKPSPERYAAIHAAAVAQGATLDAIVADIFRRAAAQARRAADEIEADQ